MGGGKREEETRIKRERERDVSENSYDDGIESV